MDDHPVVRQGLKLLINQEPDLMVCGEAENPQKAFAAIQEQHPDIAIIDLSLAHSSGIDLIKNIKLRYPDLPTLVLSMHDESLYAERVLRAGARGYIMKQEAPEKVITLYARFCKVASMSVKRWGLNCFIAILIVRKLRLSPPWSF